ncbi:Protein URG4 [Cricetulus griseus]|uniref:Protein URG4 n=1 Tax=Cricetulus griseus TaxID=10029 RepID=G3IMN6_CRIGR|nr:Protein URG4 [Cricetulus griseus]
MVLDILPDAWHAEKEPDGGDDLLGPVEDIATDDIYSFELPVPDTPVNPLDLLCALLLSSDTFLKQEVLLKMSLCQFALQFVLPDSENHYHTFLLWALQGIMQTCSFQPPRGLRSFREDSGVLSRVPTFAPFMCMDVSSNSQSPSCSMPSSAQLAGCGTASGIGISIKAPILERFQMIRNVLVFP